MTASVDAGLGLVESVVVMDRLFHRDILDAEVFSAPPGLERARGLAMPGAHSVRESLARLMLVLAGVPAPATQVKVSDAEGLIGHVDLGWAEYRVGLEYEGQQHATDMQQWQYDIDRYERMKRAGWEVPRVTAGHLRSPATFVRRIAGVLAGRGCHVGPLDLGAGWLADVTDTRVLGI